MEPNKDCVTYTVSHILKNVSIVIAILAQFTWIVWKAAQLDNRVQVLEMSFQKIEGVDIRQEMMVKQLDRLEQKIDIMINPKNNN